MRTPSMLVALAALAFAGVAEAHPKLLSSNPAANAVVAKPARIELRFSEKLVPAFSKADLVMAMEGHPAMKMGSEASVAADGKTLVLTPKTPLPAGRYSVNWQVVSADTHRITGSYAFSVK